MKHLQILYEFEDNDVRQALEELVTIYHRQKILMW